MIIEKDKIPKGTSFILRSSALLEALTTAGISVETSLQHLNSKIFFDAFFWPPRPNVQHDRFCVRAGSVPASQARPAREFMESIVLPEFIQWAQGILALPQDSPVRRSEQVFAREFIGHTPNNSYMDSSVNQDSLV
ncbi:hypothetical protein [Pseudoxanthomonas sp. UTMC 1351]|uniref:hypothetical protein n=1 Tax=Pseudoxanthomonas sp. UTMC 1351 TaxID=2695853 RepID=UPI0034CE9A9D